MQPCNSLASLKFLFSLSRCPPSTSNFLSRCSLTSASIMSVKNRKPAAEEDAAGANPSAPSAAVKILENLTVLPRNRPEKRAVPLATFDLPFVSFQYIQKLLVYSVGAEEFAVHVKKMRMALEEALDGFYPLAGKLAQGEEGLLFVDCGKEGEDLPLGVHVVIAEAEGVGVADLTDEDPPKKLIEEVVPYTGVTNIQGLSRPLLAVQFTKLKDGIALGCAFNHAIVDGTSIWYFMTSWASLARGEPVSTCPLHDRTLARPTRVPFLLPPVPAAPDANPAPTSSLSVRIFSFPEQAIHHLKSVTNFSHPVNGKAFSTFTSLAAHAWRAISRARCLPPDAITVFTVFIDCRHRIRPQIPSSYFGNLVQAVFTGTAIGRLLTNPSEFAAGILQKAIDGYDDAAVKTRLEEYEANPNILSFADAGVNCVTVASSPRFRVYDVDFGFGMPARVRSGMNNKFDGMICLYPARSGGKGIDVELSVATDVMHNLEKDEEFLFNF